MRIGRFGTGSALAMFLLAACAGDKVAGGGTDQPNTVSAVAIDAQGAFSAGASVALRKAPFRPDTDMALAWNAHPVVAETRADAKGAFAFPRVDAGDYYLDILSRDSLRVSIAPFRISGDSGYHPGKIALVGAATLHGKVRGSPVPAFYMHLAGTHYRALVGEKGEFRFPPLLPGSYRLTARAYQDAGPGYLIRDSLVLGEGANLFLDSLQLKDDSIPLFDFEDRRVRSRLRGILYPASDFSGGRLWVDDKILDTLPLGPAAEVPGLVSQGAYRGNSLRVPGQKRNRTRLFLGEGYHDFSRVAAIVFHIRAADDSASFKLGFSSKAVNEGEGTFSTRIKAGSAWTRIAVLPKDILPEGAAAANGLTWEAVRGAIAQISIYPDTAVEYWIDDVHVVGASYSDLGEATR